MGPGSSRLRRSSGMTQVGLGRTRLSSRTRREAPQRRDPDPADRPGSHRSRNHVTHRRPEPLGPGSSRLRRSSGMTEVQAFAATRLSSRTRREAPQRRDPDRPTDRARTAAASHGTHRRPGPLGPGSSRLRRSSGMTEVQAFGQDEAVVPDKARSAAAPGSTPGRSTGLAPQPQVMSRAAGLGRWVPDHRACGARPG